MPQPAGLPHPSPDYDCTLVLAIELSSKSWVLAAQVPGLAQVKAKRTIEPTKEALLEALASYRARAADCGPSDRAGSLHLRSRLVGVLAGSLPRQLLKRQLASGLVEILEAIEAVARVAHHLAGLAHVAGELQQ